ncbi:MAG TPA: Yip1 family protein [Allosphingosinicella sp.]
MSGENEKIESPPGAGIIERAKRILIEPKSEWAKIDEESSSIGEIFRGWVLVLGAIPSVASFLGAVLFGYSALGFTYRPSLMSAAGSAVTQYVLTIVGIFVLSLIIDWLAPRFGGTSNRVQAVKVAAYSATAGWIAGIFALVPSLAMLSILGLYSLYLLYLGLPRLMKAPQDKALSYTVVTIVAGFVLAMAATALMAPVSGMLGGGPRLGDVSGSVSVPGGDSLDLEALDEASKSIEAAGARIQAGDAKAVPPQTLQGLLPDALGPYRRVSLSSAAANAAGIGGSNAEARYENGDHSIRLQVIDMAAMGALATLGGALNVQSSNQTETGYEKTETVDGRLVTERWDNQSSDGSFGVVVAGRFMVEAEGTVPDVGVLKQAVYTVGIA